jgi:hypothetical protein
MTQIKEEQRGQVEAAAERVADKLKAFQDSLAADEQTVLAVALRQMAGADDGTEDTAGYSVALLERAAMQVVLLLSGLETFPPFQPGPSSP